MKRALEYFVVGSLFVGFSLGGYFLASNVYEKRLAEARGMNCFYEMSLRLEEHTKGVNSQREIVEKIVSCKERVSRDLAIHALLLEKNPQAVSEQIQNSLLDEVYAVEDYLELPSSKRVSSPVVNNARTNFYFLKEAVREYVKLSNDGKTDFVKSLEK